MHLPRLTPRQKQYGLLALGGVAAIGSLVLLWPSGPRARVVQRATDMLGVTDPRAFWRDVLPPGTPESAYPKDWCGAFALWCLHQAGLGLDIDWQIGLGFLDANLPKTDHPQAGDIAYFTNNQHHAVVTDPDVGIPGSVGLVNGNGQNGAVSASTSSNAAAYYSVQPLIDQAAASSATPWIAGGIALAGVAAYALLPSR